MNAQDMISARALAETFSRSADALNTAIVGAEAALASLGLGVPANVPCGNGKLHFGKLSSGWRIFLIPDGNGQPNPLVDCSLETRYGAVDCFPALLEALILSAERITQLVQYATTKADEFTASIKETTP